MKSTRDERLRRRVNPRLCDCACHCSSRIIVDIIQEVASGLLIFQVVYKSRIEHKGPLFPDSTELPGRFTCKGLDLLLSFNHEAESRGLATSSTERISYIGPEEWANCEADHHIKDCARLLRIYLVHVKKTWVSNSLCNS